MFTVYHSGMALVVCSSRDAAEKWIANEVKTTFLTDDRDFIVSFEEEDEDRCYSINR